MIHDSKQIKVALFIALLIFQLSNRQLITSDISLPEIQSNSTIALDSEEYHTLIDGATNLIHNGCYKEAKQVYEKIIDHYPENPVGYLYMADLYQNIMRNYRVRMFEPEFEKFINLAIEKGKIATKKDKEDALSYLCLGKAYGYLSLYKIGKCQWFGAFRCGLKGRSYLMKAVKTAPNFYDAYCGLGIYHYWRSAKSRAFWFLPFIGDDRQKGIHELWQAVNKGNHCEIDAKYSLISIYYNEANYEQAWELNSQLYELFPVDPPCLNMRGRLLEKRGEWEEAEKTVRQLLDNLTASQYNSVGYQVECHYRLALSLYKQGQFNQALGECESALLLSKSYEPSQELEDPLEDMEEILNAAKRLYENLIK